LDVATLFSKEQRATAEVEYARLMQLPSAPTYLGHRVLDYAKEHPDDTDVPEALALTVRATHYACYEWGGDTKDGEASKRAAENTAVSKAAFQMLHSRYPKSSWTAKTRYYY
jgi:outer membrane protein assembly factor BamD (BamD/ComL family)